MDDLVVLREETSKTPFWPMLAAGSKKLLTAKTVLLIGGVLVLSTSFKVWAAKTPVYILKGNSRHLSVGTLTDWHVDVALFNPHTESCSLIVAGSGCRADGQNATTQWIPPLQVRWTRVVVRTRAGQRSGQLTLSGAVGKNRFFATYDATFDKTGQVTIH